MLLIYEDEITPELLRHIASQVEQGYTSGYYPTWETGKDFQKIEQLHKTYHQ